jgi:hypothetical protein
MIRHSPMVIGHRGAAGEAPENTLASFQLAIEQGQMPLNWMSIYRRMEKL